MQFLWKTPSKHISKNTRKLARQVHLPAYVTKLLVQRGYHTVPQIKSFLHPSLDTIKKDINLPKSKNILGIDKTCHIIRYAIQHHWKIQMYDDYDVDGITSGSIMYILIRKYLGYKNVKYYIPNRFRDGYGPNLNVYKRMYRHGVNLLITTDNGISGLKEVTWMRKHGVHVIITDHHDWPTDKNGKVIKSQVPPADCICMANCPYHRFHFDDFCGAGLAFMIACHMLGKIPTNLLDLACLATIADSVSLTQENRVIVTYGLKQLRHDTRKGIRALAGQANIDLSKLTSTEVGFTINPRLNAIGRMSDANLAVQLLITNDTDEALQIAQKIEHLNSGRQSIMRQETKEALKQASSPENLKRCTLVLHDKSWFPGVVGIVASRVMDKYYKPIIVIGHMSIDDKRNIDRGSGRSIPEFNLFKAMQPMQKYDTRKYRKAHPNSKKHNVMTSFGGHPMACGLSIKPYNIRLLSAGLEHAGQRAHLDRVRPTLNPDLLLKPQDINDDTFNAIKSLEPFGVGNESPTIELYIPYVYNVRQMGNGSTLGFTLGRTQHSVHAVSFSLGNEAPKLKNNPFNVAIIGTMSINHYHGYANLQFQFKHLKHYTPCPTKHEMIILYNYLLHHKKLQFHGAAKEHLFKPLSQFLNINASQIVSTFQIFSELHFIQFNKAKHLIIANAHVTHMDLHKSPTYVHLSE